MASITICCPQCNSSLTFSPKAGEVIKGRCPKCKAELEVTIPAPEQTPTSETPEPVRPPVPRPRSTSAPASSGNSTVRWLVAGGVALALVGIMSIGCVGLGIWAYVASQETGQEVAGGPKADSGAPENGDSEQPLQKPSQKSPDQTGETGAKKNDPTNGSKKEPITVAKEKQPNEPANTEPITFERGHRLSKDEWAGRALIIPFDAVATRERLEEIQLVQIKGKIKFTGFSHVNDAVITWESLKRIRYDEQSQSGDDNTLLLIRGYGWSKRGRNILTMDGDGLGFYQNFNYAMILSNLIALTDAEFKVKEGTDRLIRGTPCSSAIVTRSGRPPMTLYFSKDTKLLFKADFTGKFLGPNNKFVPFATYVEFYFGDYYLIDGVNHWRKREQWRDGKKYNEMNLSEVKFLKKSDDSLFAVNGLEAEIRRVTAEYELADRKEMMNQTLARLGPDSGSEFSRLVKGLSHPDASVRPLARNALLVYAEAWRKNQLAPFERTDAASLAALLKTGEDAELQSLAIEGITRLGPQAPEAVVPLVNLARDNQDPRTLAAALVALRTIAVKTPDTLAVFEKHLDHADISVKDPAALGMLQLGPERLKMNRLLELMARPNEEIRAAADKLLRQKLANITAKELPELRQGLKNPVREIRLAFLDAIGSLKEEGKEAAPDLIPLIGSADKEVPERAILALEKMGRLVEVARDNSDAAILKPTLGALRAKKIKTAEALAVCEKHLDHADVGVKDAAALVLLDLEPERLQADRLAEFVSSTNEEVRTAGEKLLRKKLTSVAAKDLPSLRQGLKSPSRDVRIVFVDAIASLKADGKDAAPDLADLLGPADKDLSLPIMRALEGMGKAGAKAAPALEKKIADADKSVALAATLALCKVDPANAVLKTQGIDVLLQDLNPDVTKLNALLTRPLGSQSTAALLDLGEPAVAPLVKHLLSRNNPKSVPQNQQVEATAGRFLGYELMKEFAKRAKANDDKKLTLILKKYEISLKAVWEPQEAGLAKQAKLLFALPPETRQLYAATAESAYQSYKAISALR